MEKPTVIVETVAPIPLDVLKRKFTEDIEFHIDYEGSKLKGKVLITYLSNLKIKCRLILKDPEITLSLIEEYLSIPVLVDMPDLADHVMNLLLDYTGKPSLVKGDQSAFYNRNFEMLDKWVNRLYMMPLFALYCMGEQYHEYVESFPKDEDDGIAGINFVNLLRHPMFSLMLEGVEEQSYSWNPTFFKEYIFQGANLFHYFADKNNPLFMGVLAVQGPESFAAFSQALNDEYRETQALLKGIQHVPSL